MASPVAPLAVFLAISLAALSRLPSEAVVAFASVSLFLLHRHLSGHVRPPALDLASELADSEQRALPTTASTKASSMTVDKSISAVVAPVTPPPSSVASKQPAKPVTANEWPGLTPEEASLANQLIATLRADPSFSPDHISMELCTVNAVRFLRARNWSLQKAEQLWRGAVEWRISFGMTERRKRLKSNLGRHVKDDFCSSHWMMWHMCDDKLGVPVVLFRAGTSDPAGLIRETGSVDDFIERHVAVTEEALEAAFERGMAHKGLVDVTDLREFPEVGQWYSRCYNSVPGFMQLARILDNHYPERVRVVVLIGAPSVFQFVWRMFQSVIPPETKKKIKMFGVSHQADWVAELHKHVDAVPRYLGGTGPNNRVLLGDIVSRGSYETFTSTWRPSLVLGLIADVQYADIDDGPNFAKTRIRKYRSALEIGLRRAVDEWREYNVQQVVQVGDAIDGYAKRNQGSLPALNKVIGVFSELEQVPVHHLIGNHELYNFSRAEMQARFNALVSWRSTRPMPGWRLVFLDSYAESVLGVDKEHPTFQRASQLLGERNPNPWETAGDWHRGLYSLERRWVPYNGQLGKEQLTWLRTELTEAVKAEERVVVFTHVPLCPGSASSSCLVFDFDLALELLDSFASSRHRGRAGVVAVFAGHDHKGGYALDAAGIHHVTLASPLEAPKSVAHAVGVFGDGGVTLVGAGAVESRRLAWCASVAEAVTRRQNFLKEECLGLFELCKGSKTLEACKAAIEAHGGAWDYLGPDWPKRYND